MARLLADENFPYASVQKLRQLGHDVETALEAGVANQRLPDERVLEYARTVNRAALTQNRRDFIRLHRRHPTHGGIIVCTRDDEFEALALRIDEALAQELSL